MILLHVEDNPADADFIAELLEDDGNTFEVHRATSLRQGVQVLSQTAVDVVLLDLCLPESQGLTTLETLLAEAPHVACIIIAGQEEQDLALQAGRLGAHDYLAKGSIDSFSLKKSIYYAIERRRFRNQLLLNCAVSNALTQATNEEEMLQSCSQAIVDCLDATFARIWTFDKSKQVLNLRASAGLYTHIDGSHAEIPLGHLKVGLIAEERRPVLINSVQADECIHDKEWAKRERITSFAGYPLLSDGELLGVLALFARHPLDDSALDALASLSRQLAIGIERKEAIKQIHLLEAREELMATLSHDLKNPLIGMGRILEFLSENKLGPITDQQRDIFYQLQRSNSNLLSIIQNLVDVYRYEKDTDCLSSQKIDLGELASDCIVELTPIADHKQITITLQTPEILPPLYADQSAIKRVIQNLLGNALKFTPLSGTITLAVHRDDATLTLDVHNTGSTISEQDRQLLFRRFWQGGQGRRYAAGTGLGLYLCKQIIAAHRGEIGCRSQEQVGTTFSFTLPLSAVQKSTKLESAHV